jgi:hypothetical protein
MKTEHLTEFEIQDYLYGDAVSTQDIKDHLNECASCRLRTAQVEKIFEMVKELEKPVFDFNLAALVSEKLPGKKQEFSFGKYLLYLFIFVSVPATAALICLFSTSLSHLVMGLTPLLFILLAITAAGLILFQWFDTFQHYNKYMKVLNSYQDATF